MIDAQIWEVSIKLKKPETEVKNQNPFFFNEKLPQDLEVTYGNVGPDRVSWASHFLFGKNSNECHRRPACDSCRS